MVVQCGTQAVWCVLPELNRNPINQHTHPFDYILSCFLCEFSWPHRGPFLLLVSSAINWKMFKAMGVH